MRRLVPFILIAMLLAAFAGMATADPASTPDPMGAGTESGGWVTLTYPDSRAPISGESDPRPPLQQLYYLPADSPPGALYGAMQLSEKPHAIAASGSRVILLFPPSNTGDGGTRWKVRALTAFDQPDPIPPVFEPKGRLEILPSLETEGEVVGFCGIPGGGVAALIRPVADALDILVGEQYELKALLGGEWQSIRLPRALIGDGSCRLLPDAKGLTLLFINPLGPIEWNYDVWKGVISKGLSPGDAAIDPGWERLHKIKKITGIEKFMTTASGHILSVALLRADSSVFQGDDGSNPVRLSLQLPGSETALAELNNIPEQFALTRVGDTAALVYLSDDPKPQVMTAVVHTSTGEILYQGAHVKIPPLTSDDLRFLGFVLGLVLMTALVFVLRPATASTTEAKLPPGTAMATPERRLAAGLIDFILPLVVVVEIWGTGLMDVILAPIQAERADEFWPFAVTSLAFFGHTCFSEWLFRGRTLGKVILRIRVASIIGERLTLWQCICRNTIKLVCPPLLILIFADPRRRHPGDTIAGAVVITLAKGPEPPEHGDDDNKNDDDTGRASEETAGDG